MSTLLPVGPVEAVIAAMVFALVVALALGRLTRRVQQSLPQLDGHPACPTVRAVSRARPIAVHGVPVLAMAFGAASVWGFGASLTAIAAIVFIVALLVLARIDAETGFLPDVLTLPLLWAGLLVNLDGLLAPLADAVLGAVAGYLTLWVVYQAFLSLTGKEGLGYGDFKLLAAVGAWIGWAALPWVLLLSSSLALLAALFMRATGRMAPGDALSFGPWLAAAGILVLFVQFGVV